MASLPVKGPDMALAIQQSYPPPPPWYTEFTKIEDVNNRPPPPLPERTYTCFGWPKIAVQLHKNLQHILVLLRYWEAREAVVLHFERQLRSRRNLVEQLRACISPDIGTLDQEEEEEEEEEEKEKEEKKEEHQDGAWNEALHPTTQQMIYDPDSTMEHWEISQ